MKQKSLISVVMPVYNAGKYLREAIESILNQTYQNFEFLIINDGSTDNSDEIIKSFVDPRIIYLQNGHNRGFTYTLNLGINNTNGQFIARMDADDISEPNRFERQLEVFMNDPDIGVCGTWARIIGTNKILKVELENERIKCSLFFTNQFIHPSIMIRKVQFGKSGLKYEEVDFPADDYGLWIKLSESTKMVNLSEPLLNYRVHASQISSSISEWQIQKTNELRIQQILNFLNYNPSPWEQDVHLLFLNSKYIFHGHSDLKNIEKWLLHLIELNNRCNYFNSETFKNCIKLYYENRFIYQNYNNNNPLFLVSFYLYYFQSIFKFSFDFHLKFIIKCLIFYKIGRRNA